MTFIELRGITHMRGRLINIKGKVEGKIKLVQSPGDKS